MINKINIKNTTILAKNWGTLSKIDFDFTNSNNETHELSREVYDHGDGASILLYNLEKKTVILTKQFRMPFYLHDRNEGMSIEACAGLLDGDDPETCAKREALEETGFQVTNLEKVCEVYASPGSLSEFLYLYVAEYTDADKIEKGGGLDEEFEDIEILELPFSEALALIKKGKIQDSKTVILLQHILVKGIM
ncbi:NUDIX domain-containing protein [Zhouia sp. PK063]|uniref:NUDIX domain-containing protein n=1 Tax=Zhouia sp. PK063 TaxID=3373602 RepID=UPI0037AE31E5